MFKTYVFLPLEKYKDSDKVVFDSRTFMITETRLPSIPPNKFSIKCKGIDKFADVIDIGYSTGTQAIYLTLEPHSFHDWNDLSEVVAHLEAAGWSVEVEEKGTADDSPF
jgi:hypothetical protein